VERVRVQLHPRVVEPDVVRHRAEDLAPHGLAVDGAAEARVVEEDGPGEVALQAELQLREEGEKREGGVEVDVVGVVHVVLHPFHVQELPHVLVAAAWERSVADAMALTMPSTALPPPVGASSKNGRDEAKPAFFGGCPSVAYISLSVANS